MLEPRDMTFVIGLMHSSSKIYSKTEQCAMGLASVGYVQGEEDCKFRAYRLKWFRVDSPKVSGS